MFEPPRCPNQHCDMFSRPEAGFWTLNGSYWPKCRPEPVPRFRCRLCRKSFSRQTFRADYRDHRPDANRELFLLLVSGVGLRQCARVLGITRRCIELKARKITRHLAALNRNLLGPMPPGACFQLDELETYEGRRNTRPLTLPVLIERDSRFLLWAGSAPIRPRGKMTDERLAAIAEDEARFGRRRDRSRAALKLALEELHRWTGHHPRVLLETDEKSIYPVLGRRVLGEDRLVHATVNSKLVRDTFNPLFPINNTEAIFRDLTGRLRRESWLASKQRRYLNGQLMILMTWRNFVRRRFNHDKKSSAQVLGLTRRRMRFDEVVGWRQDWGARSIHPMARRTEAVADARSQGSD